GYPITATTVPSGSIQYSNATQGALLFPAPGAGLNYYLAKADMSANCPSAMYLIDRLVSIGGFVGNNTTLQSNSTPALTRFTSGAGVMMMLEQYGTTSLGGTASTLTASYTNQNGVAGQQAVVPSQTWGITGEIQRAVVLPLAAGDTGVQSVQSVQWGTATGGSGTFCITLFKLLRAIPAGNKRQMQDVFNTNLTPINAAACLALLGVTAGSSVPKLQVSGSLTLIQA
ncbi:MAG: hypothetical protein ACREP1_10485, partial [Rhodanobacteraceae bacterium]